MSAKHGADLRAEVMRLHYLDGLGIRAIARQLRISRKTVRRHLGRLPPAADKKTGRRPSLLDPYEDKIHRWLTATPELKATHILERLRRHGYRGGISIVRERVRKLRPSPALTVYLTVNHHPGGTLQVDWVDFGFALPGIPRRVSGFVVTVHGGGLVESEHA